MESSLMPIMKSIRWQLESLSILGPHSKNIHNLPPPVLTRPVYTEQQVADHCDTTSCWIIITGKVYDITKFIAEHPGGQDVLLEHAGRDVTGVFAEVGHSSDAVDILEKYYIGDLVEEDDCDDKMNH